MTTNVDYLNEGVLFITGSGGHEKNIQTGLNLIYKAAVLDSPEAQYMLGGILFVGKKVKKDVNNAVLWYKKAADNGHPQAMVRLGICYVNGWGVAPDSKVAIQLFTRAADTGNAEAQFRLAVAYFNGTGVTKNLAISKDYLSRALSQRYDDAYAFSENHPEIMMAGLPSTDIKQPITNNYNTTINVGGDYISDNRGVIAKGSAIVNNCQNSKEK